MQIELNNKLIKFINLFIKNKIKSTQLQDYCWKIIDEYTENEQTDLSTDPSKSIFWFAIWQIQHLATEEHKEDGTLERELKITLGYLRDPKLIPPGVYGLPPQAKKNKKTTE